MGLILVCVMGMFILISRNSIASQSLSEASIDSARATALIINGIRTSGVISLPGDQDFQCQSGYTAQSYQTTYQSSPVYAAITLWFPAAGSSIKFPGASSSYSVMNRTNVGNSILFYRSDSQGKPAPSSGTCLWAYGSMNGAAYNQAIITSVASAANAVQFVRPNVSFSSEIAIKIVSSYYSPIHNASSDEATNGQLSTTLTGKCVMSRDVYTGTNSAISQSTTGMVSGGHWYSY